MRQTPISSQYYSRECRNLEGYKNICFNCLVEGQFAKEDALYVRNFKAFLPRCENCKAMGKESFLRKSKISKNKKNISDTGKTDTKINQSKSKLLMEEKQNNSVIQKKNCANNKSIVGSNVGEKRKFYSVFSIPSTNRYYLDATTSPLRGNARNEISKHGIIQNVCGNGNCGIYASMEGLLKAGITCTIDVNIFRKNVYDYISKNIKSVLPQLQFSGKRKKSGAIRGKMREQYITTEVLDRIWNNNYDFNEGCGEPHWVVSSLHFPIFAEMFSTNFIWFDVNNIKTYGAVLVKKKNKKDEKLQERIKDGYISPSTFIEDSIWKKTVVIVHYANHYQHLQLH